MKGLLPPIRRAPASRFRPQLEALEERQLLSGFQMRLEQPGFDPLIINDNGPGDFHPLEGVIVFIGAYGTFPVNSIAGFSMRGADGEQQLLLSSVNVAGPEGGALRIILAQDDVLLPSGGGALRSDAGGVLSPGQTLGFQSWVDPTNNNEAAGLTPGQHGPTTSPAYAGSLSGDLDAPPTTCSLVNEVNLSFDSFGITSFTLYSSLKALQPEEPEINPDPGLLLPE